MLTPDRYGKPRGALYGIVAVTAILIAAFLLDQIVRVASGEKTWDVPRTVTTTTKAPVITGGITVIDGDTVRASGSTFRLIGFNAPEGGRDAGCDKERQLAAKATARMK